ncbi:MAG: hypothetical protein ACREQY_00910, partial [Candidatus Binatia bacterium]
MKKTIAALIPLAIVGVITAGFVNCGSTGGSGSGTGDQFVNTSCNPDDNCLELSAPGRLVVGESGTFRARLVDGSGNPISGVQLCFEVENDAGDIVDPPGGCGTTDANGIVSGTVRAGVEGSHLLIASAPSGFGLTVRRRIIFTAAELCTSEADCQANQFCAEGGGECELPDGACVADRANGQCCENDNQCISRSCPGGTCESEEVEPTPVPTPAPQCSDDVDNDGDGLVDFPNDPGCASDADSSETDPAAQCSDNIDNDDDGFTDFGTEPSNDPQCS